MILLSHRTLSVFTSCFPNALTHVLPRFSRRVSYTILVFISFNSQNYLSQLFFYTLNKEDFPACCVRWSFALESRSLNILPNAVKSAKHNPNVHTYYAPAI